MRKCRFWYQEILLWCEMYTVLPSHRLSHPDMVKCTSQYDAYETCNLYVCGFPEEVQQCIGRWLRSKQRAQIDLAESDR